MESLTEHTVASSTRGAGCSSRGITRPFGEKRVTWHHSTSRTKPCTPSTGAASDFRGMFCVCEKKRESSERGSGENQKNAPGGRD